MPVPINPDTRVGDLLADYPALEETLVSLAPAFAKLKNPLLRRTVAKIATLEQAARIGGIPVRELVLKLREAAGVSGEAVEGGEGSPGFTGDAPEWLSRCQVRFRIDGDEMLERGVHPIGEVRKCAAALQAGEMVLLTTSFRPEPLIETMRRGGLSVFSAESSPGRHSTYIARIGAD
jgi:hypothetical protein